MISFFNVHEAWIEERMGEHRFWRAPDTWHLSARGSQKTQQLYQGLYASSWRVRTNVVDMCPDT